ncbi:MAG: Lipopolysaccharide core heptosyltransferase RfaQ [Chlamydiae bacterium]|nr:Lipopolysaccharide core heptosyltransferase RfaQ [Chlamydiota bacterium]
MTWKNRLIKVLLWFFNPETTRTRRPQTPSSFLIVSTTGLGDTLWGTPAMRALRQSFPDAEISVLTSTIGAAVLKHNKHIDELFVLSSSPFFSFFRFFLTLRKRKFDSILVFHTSQRIVLPFCALLEAPQIIGTRGINKDLDFLLTKALPQKYQHEIDRRLDIVREIGAHVSDYALEITFRKQEEQNIRRFLEGNGIPEHIPLVGLHPGAKNAFKQWPKESFIEVGKRLMQHLGCQILVSGDQSEALIAYEIASKIPGAIPIAGELELSSFAALLKKMMVFITNDTGPMHIAFATQTPTIAIFGPTDPNLCGPFHVKNAHVLATPKTCNPCLKKNCADPFCLLAIGPDAVYDAVLTQLAPYLA